MIGYYNINNIITVPVIRSLRQTVQSSVWFANKLLFFYKIVLYYGYHTFRHCSGDVYQDTSHPTPPLLTVAH